MAETEKITVNLSIVDLGKIDLLVDEGFYSNRTDFIRTGIRNLFISHADSLQQSIKRHFAVVGTLIIGPMDLERALSKNEKRSYSVIGMLWIKNDVSPDLADAVIEKIRVRGVFRASDEVKSVLADRRE